MYVCVCVFIKQEAQRQRKLVHQKKKEEINAKIHNQLKLVERKFNVISFAFGRLRAGEIFLRAARTMALARCFYCQCYCFWIRSDTKDTK